MLSRYERGTREPDVVTAMTLSFLYDLPLNDLFPLQGALNRRLKKRERMLTAWRRDMSALTLRKPWESEHYSMSMCEALAACTIRIRSLTMPDESTLKEKQ
jgi:hypothetical protein